MPIVINEKHARLRWWQDRSGRDWVSLRTWIPLSWSDLSQRIPFGTTEIASEKSEFMAAIFYCHTRFKMTTWQTGESMSGLL